MAPALNRRQAALPWRFWASGNSFYAAGRRLGRSVKVSFHPNGNWQLRVDSAVSRLISRIEVLPGWLHALSVQWTILPGALMPSAEEDIELLVETAYGWKQSANLLVSTSETSSDPPLPGDSRLLPWAATLSDGRRIALNIANTPQAEHELEEAVQMRRKLPIINSGKYAEYVEHRLGREPGNVVIVLPLGPESFGVVET